MLEHAHAAKPAIQRADTLQGPGACTLLHHTPIVTCLHKHAFLAAQGRVIARGVALFASPSLCTLGNRLLPLDRACSCCRGTAFACLCWACRGARGLRSWMNAREEHGNCVAQRETHAPLGAIEAAQSLRGRVAFICERKQSGANATRKRCSRESTARPEVHQMGC